MMECICSISQLIYYYYYSLYGYSRYTVRRKFPSVSTDICDIIKKHHPNDCGLIYCLTTKDCELLAQQLQVLYPPNIIVHSLFYICIYISKSLVLSSFYLVCWIVGPFLSWRITRPKEKPNPKRVDETRQ